MKIITFSLPLLNATIEVAQDGATRIHWDADDEHHWKDITPVDALALVQLETRRSEEDCGF